MQDDYYNKGYKDAESVYDEVYSEGGEEEGMDIEEREPMSDGQMPEEMLMGIENMSDEELELLLEKQPNLIELLK